MTLQPYPSRSKLVAKAQEAGCVVSHENGQTMIENGVTTLKFSANTEITDGNGKEMKPDEAFKALGLSLA